MNRAKTSGGHSGEYGTVRDILDGKYNERSFISVAGIITDFRAPIATRGTDWKCQISIYDKSVEDVTDESLLLNIFWPRAEMPDVECGDFLVVFSARVQRFNSGTFSLCTHRDTDVYVYLAREIPKPPGEASKAMRPVKRPKCKYSAAQKDHQLVSKLYNSISKDRVPTEAEFEVMKINSTNVKDKFSELKDARDGTFIDTIAQLVMDPYDLGDKITLWISDYTENPAFYKFNYDGENDDPYGYGSKSLSNKAQLTAARPYGRLSMQVTCWDPHTSVLRSEGLKATSWVWLRNLQIKYGSNVNNLEGFLRGDKGSEGSTKINISHIDFSEDPDAVDPRFKNAVRRKRDYEKQKKQEMKGLTEAAMAGQKRRRALENESSKTRRKNKRAHLQKNGKSQSMTADYEAGNSPPTLNPSVTCENDKKEAITLTYMTQPGIYKDADGGKLLLQHELPFLNLNFRANVRIVNFYPSRLEDFAFPKPRRAGEYSMLSDNEDSESDDSDDDSERVVDSNEPVDWTWHFYLNVEDAVAPEGRPSCTAWVYVDNEAAQMLLGDDASDLHRDERALATLRYRLSLLWGNLEEYKASIENRALTARSLNNGRPPEHSDDEGEATKAEPRVTTVSNRPFACCIRQYGVKVRENDENRADAGEGWRWQRMFGLFGTKICIE